MRRLIIVGTLLLGAVLVWTATARQRSVVAWRPLRAVVLESDDWGLAGFVPDADAWRGLDREALRPGRFPAVYWHSTLEDSATVAALSDVLARWPGADGLPAVLQPNYVMSSLSWEGEPGVWRRYDWPQVPPAYRRPGLWSSVRAAMARGTWYPEFHATWHYDPRLRRERTASSEMTLAAARRGIMLFPGDEQAYELGPWRSTAELAGELDGSLARFRSAFGRRPGSIIAPDYTWDARVESLWSRRGLDVVQAKREQRYPGLRGDLLGRALKVARRQWERWRAPGRVYLERNCRLETAQAPDAAAVVAACLRDVRRAWARGEPAVVETHRVNFGHTDPVVVRAGLEALATVLAALAEDEAAQPNYMTDMELAQLAQTGVSWCVRGGRVVLRNGTAARRVVAVPAAALELAADQAGLMPPPPGPRLVLLAPRSTHVLDPVSLRTPPPGRANPSS